MDTNKYDYLNGLEEEDRVALIAMAKKREENDDAHYKEAIEASEDRLNMQTGAFMAGIIVTAITVGTVWFAASSMKDYGRDLKPVTSIGEVVDDNVYVIRNYIVEMGDNLTYLSKISGMTIDEIKDFNHLKSDMIKYNQKISLKYTIEPENIKYLTDSVLVDNRSIYEIAGLYHTTPESIYGLNKESIEKIVKQGAIDDYIILSNTLLVPNYKTPSELQKVKK